MKIYEVTHRKTRKIKRLLRAKRYNMDAFFAACPYTLEELKSKDRKHDIVCWRHLAMTWQLLSGENLTGAGKVFDRSHATVYNSLIHVLNTVEGFGSSVMADAIKRVREHSTVSCVRIDSHQISEFLSRHIDEPDEVEELTRSIFEIVNNKKPLI